MGGLKNQVMAQPIRIDNLKLMKFVSNNRELNAFETRFIQKNKNWLINSDIIIQPYA